jgi:hypothetical protein
MDTRTLKAGDILWANHISRGLPYNHCGVYVGNGQVIHFAPERGATINPANAVIHQSSIKDFAKGCPVSVIDLPGKYSAEETVKRAKSRLGEGGYEFFTNNCDHFATWCKTGKHQSIQVEGVKAIIKTLGGDKGELFCDIFSAIESSNTPEIKKASGDDSMLATGVRMLVNGTDAVLKAVDKMGKKQKKVQ